MNDNITNKDDNKSNQKEETQSNETDLISSNSKPKNEFNNIEKNSSNLNDEQTTNVNNNENFEIKSDDKTDIESKNDNIKKDEDNINIIIIQKDNIIINNNEIKEIEKKYCENKKEISLLSFITFLLLKS